MKTIRIDTGCPQGDIRPLHGVGGGPVTKHFSYDAGELFRAAGIPFGRTHDIEYPFGAGEYVDIHCVFPRFDADVNDPANYNFVFTDEYLKAMLACGTQPFYRLGATIEHQPIKRYIHPPKDNAKWGEICSHIIAHYNKGWANGFHMGITYWEIWNEPDLANRCWTGTDEQFFALYDEASVIIKRDHPEIKLGGCAFTSPRAPMAEKWLAHIRESGAPMDFFSWHGYIYHPDQARELSEYAAMLLEKYGFADAESIYDEWNYVVAWDDTIQQSIDRHKTAHCASFVAAVMATLQQTRTDKAMYYDWQMGMQTWNGVFTPGKMRTHGDPMPIIVEKPYYAFKAWHALTKAGNSLAVEADEGLYAAAAGDEKQVWLLVSNYSDDGSLGPMSSQPTALALDIPGTVIKAEAWVTDNDQTESPVPFDGKALTLAPDSLALLHVELA